MLRNTSASEKEQVIKDIGGKLLCLWKEVIFTLSYTCLSLPEPPNWSMLSLSFGGICFLFFTPPFQGGSDVIYFETSIDFSFLSSQGCIYDNKRGSHSCDSLSLCHRWWGWTNFYYELQSEAFIDCSLLCKNAILVPTSPLPGRTQPWCLCNDISEIKFSKHALVSATWKIPPTVSIKSAWLKKKVLCYMVFQVDFQDYVII